MTRVNLSPTSSGFKFDNHCSSKKNVVHEMYQFLTYRVGSLNQFVTELKSRVKTCEFVGQEKKLVMGRIVHGI